ncbi:hypothetical protein M9458_038003, partial [Cirrhinus mrigala]
TSKRDVLTILNLLPQHGVTGEDMIGHNVVYRANLPNGHRSIDCFEESDTLSDGFHR